MFQDNEKLLRYTLIANSIFSAVSGIVLFFFDQFFTSFFAIEYDFYQTGISLVLFSLLVLYTGLRSQINNILVWIIITMDILWVAGSIILLLSPVILSAGGNWSVIIVAVFVADFALFQYRGLRKATLSVSQENL